MTLLEKALAVPLERNKCVPVSEDLYALSVAWARGRITTRQAADAMGINGSSQNTINKLSQGLRDAVKSGYLVERAL